MLIESVIIFFGMLLVSASIFFRRDPIPALPPAPDVPDWIRDIDIYPFGEEINIYVNADKFGYINFSFYAKDGYGCFFAWADSEITGFGDTALEAFQDVLRRHLQAGYSDKYIREIQANLEALTPFFESMMSHHDPAYKPIRDVVFAGPKRTFGHPDP